MVQTEGPEFIRFFYPIIETLRELGGSGSTAEVIDNSIEKLNLPEEEQEILLKSGTPKVRNQAQWARLYLVKVGLLSSSKRGVWGLTEKGWSLPLTEKAMYDAYQEASILFREEHKLRKKSKKQEEDDLSDGTESEELLTILQNLPPGGFEKVCQRLLRESGFQQVTITGRSGDGGIDGYGVLEVNPLVSFNVLFQCKRYQGSVSPSTVRDFRGAMQGRADKGIILTTGSFTLEAKKEARRDGVPPIELVDGEKLVEMFQDLELGVVPKTIYEIDKSFFDEYQ